MNKTNMFFQFLLNQIKGYRENKASSRRFRNYYMSNKEDMRGDTAKILDFMISRIMVFFIAFIVSFFKTGVFNKSLIITIVCVCIFHVISIKLRDKKLEIMKKQKRRYIASQKIYQEIMNNTVEELKKFIIEILEKTGFYGFIHKWSNHKLIIYEALYNEESILISTYIYKNDYYVELKDLKEFINYLRVENYRKGILMTTSDFTKDCYQYLDQMGDEYKILLLNKEMMLKLIEKNDMFPSEEEIDELVENKISRKEAVWEKYKSTMLANKKSRSYFLLSVFLLLSAYYTPYPIYYMIVASGTLILTLITLILRLLNKNNAEEEGWDSFQKILKEL